MLYKKLASIFDCILPALCLLCGDYTRSSQQICRDCLRNLPDLPPHCWQCADFLYDAGSSRCGACLRQPPSFDRSFACFPYQWPVTSLIIKLKFQHQLPYAQCLGNLMAQQIQTQWYAQQTLPDLILPIPLHSTRLQERGFNQAVEIAKPIARILQRPLDTQGLGRIRATASQSGLPAAKRKQNVAGAFVTERSYQDLHLALLDDVITTGHTVRECSRVLKMQGARRVDVWCCARRG